MAVFVVIAPDASGMEPFQAAIKDIFPNDHFVIGPNVWAVAALGISKEVSEKITEASPARGNATIIVLSVSGYYGYAVNSVWEWFASKQGTVPNVAR